MSVVFQIAGKYRPGAGEKLAGAFAEFKQHLAGCDGFERAMLLTNHSLQQLQLLLYFSSYEQALAFYSGVYPTASRAFAPVVEPQGTLITSQLEVQIERAA